MIQYVLIILFGLLLAHPALAQGETPGQPPEEFIEQLAEDLSELQALSLAAAPPVQALRVTRRDADIYAGASTNSDQVGTLGEGQVLPVIDKANDWYAVQLRDGETGWINAGDVVPEGQGWTWTRGILDLGTGEVTVIDPSTGQEIDRRPPLTPGEQTPHA